MIARPGLVASSRLAVHAQAHQTGRTHKQKQDTERRHPQAQKYIT